METEGVPFTWKGYRGEARSEVEGRASEILAFLLPPQGLPAGAVEVKRNLYRSVFRISDGPAGLGPVYFKRYRFPRWSDLLKYSFFQTRAEVEWKVACGLASRGIASLEPLLYAERAALGVPRDALFLSREIEGAQPLDRFLPLLDGAQRARFFEALARFLAALHEKAVHHRDLHQSNLLARRAEAPEIFVVDLHAVRLGGEVTNRERVANLAQLLHSLRPVLRPGEAEGLLERYRKEAGEPFEHPQTLLPRILRRIERIDRRHARSRDKRCLFESSAFAVRRGPFASLFRRRDFPEEEISRAILLHREAPRDGKSELLKEEGRGRLTRVVFGERQLCVKEVGLGGLGALVEEAFRGSRGRRAWLASHVLARRGIPAPAAFALREEGLLGLPLRSYLLAEYLEKTASAWSFFESGYPALTRGERFAFLQALGRFVADLHRSGLYHRDLQLRNILVRRPSGAEQPWRLYLVDLESLRPGAGLTPKRILRNLMQLNDCPPNVPWTDRVRFLRAYETVLGRRLEKGEKRRVLRATRARLARAAGK